MAEFFQKEEILKEAIKMKEEIFKIINELENNSKKMEIQKSSR